MFFTIIKIKGYMLLTIYKTKNESVFSAFSTNLSSETLGRSGLVSEHHSPRCLKFFYLALFFNKVFIIHFILTTQISRIEI